MTTVVSQCLSCKHLELPGWKCEAYPDGIPMDVLTNEREHTQVLDDQTGTTVHESGEPQVKSPEAPNVPQPGKAGW